MEVALPRASVQVRDVSQGAKHKKGNVVVVPWLHGYYVESRISTTTGWDGPRRVFTHQAFQGHETSGRRGSLLVTGFPACSPINMYVLQVYLFFFSERGGGGGGANSLSEK